MQCCDINCYKMISIEVFKIKLGVKSPERARISKSKRRRAKGVRPLPRRQAGAGGLTPFAVSSGGSVEGNKRFSSIRTRYFHRSRVQRNGRRLSLKQSSVAASVSSSEQKGRHAGSVVQRKILYNSNRETES